MEQAAPAKRIAGVLQVQERRRASRHEVRLRLLFPWGDRILQAHTVDLSETGMKLESLADLGRGTRLVMHFAPTGETITQRVEGEVMWVKAPSGGATFFTCGFRFLSMSPEAQSSIRRIIAAQEASEVTDDDIVEGSTEPADGGWGAELQKAVHNDHDRFAERRREADALVNEARHASGGGEYGKAVRLLEQALQLTPESRDIMEELARILYLKGDVARAAELFDRALRQEQR